ncbi:MAG: cupin domain-containing protein [Chloroflexi bacterium]|nr:cupin domain-containing protein [Chloroflexota bacterium]
MPDAKLVRKVLDKPDETRSFTEGKGKAQIVKVGDVTLGRGIFEPGWQWSKHVKPIAKTDSCQAAHTGMVLEGRMRVRMNDGTESEVGPGDAFYMPPGHDAWIVGNQRCVIIDVTGFGNYAKPK